MIIENEFSTFHFELAKLERMLFGRGGINGGHVYFFLLDFKFCMQFVLFV
jgi:hypothetical protein